MKLDGMDYDGIISEISTKRFTASFTNLEAMKHKPLGVYKPLLEENSDINDIDYMMR